MAIIRKSKGKQKKNPFLAELSGQVGKQFVIKQYKNVTVLSNFPDMSHVKPTAKQKAKRTLFQRAVSYAKEINNDPTKKAAYAKKLKGKRNVYQAALSEYMNSRK